MRMETNQDPSLLEARGDYFERSGFAADGGYNDEWVHVDLGRFSIKFPNSDARKRAVRYHDLHHVVTGYATDLQGEAEISAWEIASGCGTMIAAWILNLLAFGHMLLRKPKPLYRAFVRGRQSRNLYGRAYNDALLAQSVSETRIELGLDELQPGDRGGHGTRARDRFAFLFWGSLAVSLAWGPIILPIAIAASALG